MDDNIILFIYYYHLLFLDDSRDQNLQKADMTYIALQAEDTN